MAKKFDFEGARRAGYSNEEIANHLSQNNPNFDVQGAIQSGYSPEEVYEHLNTMRQPSRAKSIASAGFKGLRRGLSTLPTLTPQFGPVPEALQEKLSEHFLPSRHGGAEEFAETAGEILPSVALGPEGWGMKAAQLGLAAGAKHIAKQEGAGPGTQLAAELVGFMAPGAFKSLGLKALSMAQKGFTKGAGEAVSKVTKIKPEQINEAVRGAAERLNVLEDLPLSAQVENPIIQSAEAKLLQSAAGGPLQQKVGKATEKLTDIYKDVGREVSQRENLLPSVVSAEAANVLQDMEKGAEQAYRSLYAQASSALPENAMTLMNTGKAIHKVIDHTLNKLKSALGTPAKDALYNRLSRLKDAWSATPELREGLIPIRELETLKQDLNQVIKYEVKGGVDKLLQPLQGVTKEAIQTYGRHFNPQYMNRFNQAERIFKENAQTFRKNPVLSSLASGERPEQIFSKMGTVKGINELEKVFNKTPEGKEAMDALKKYKLEDLLNRRVLDKYGNVSWGKAAGMFKEPKVRDIVIKLVGPEQYKRLKDLSTVSGGLEEGFRKYLNTSKTFTNAADLALFGALPIKAAGQLFSGNILGAAKSTALILGPNMIAKLVSNPKFVDAAIEAAKAGRGSSAQRFIEALTRVAQFALLEMSKSGQNQQEPKFQETDFKS
jgi:hypothetical protein